MKRNKTEAKDILFESKLKYFGYGILFTSVSLIIIYLFFSELEAYITSFAIKEYLNINNFNLINQLIIPIITGCLGGVVSYQIGKVDIEYDNKKLHGKFLLYLSLGGLAGWLAVNLLNPSGTTSQVSVLGFIAGMSGLTYLKRNALVEASLEKDLFGAKKYRRKIIEEYGSISDEFIELDNEKISQLEEEFMGIYKKNV